VISARLRARFGLDVAAMHSDDGIVLRLPDSGGGWDGDPWGMSAAGPEDGESGVQTEHVPGRVTLEDLLLDPDEVLGAVRDELGSSVMFAARFREAAARALLLPRRRPDKRQPLWQQRQRSAQLLEVASQFPDFPIVLEAARECLQDDFDVTALSDLMREIAGGGVRVVEVTTPTPSPFAQSLLFGYTAQFLYDGDAPLAERRAAALSLDPDLLAELLGEQGTADLADLLDPGAVERTEAELAGLARDRQARDAEGLWDLLRRTGPHPLEALEARTREEARHALVHWLDELEATRRVIRVRFAGAEQWAVAEDAGRLRDALGVALPVGIPETFTELVPDPLGDLLRRHARTHGPFGATAVAQRFGLGVAIVTHGLARLEAAGVLARGSLRPGSLGGTGDEWCDPGVLRLLRRRSLAALRAEVEPVEQEALGAFLPRWQNVSTGLLRGADGLVQAIEQLAGAAVPASALETLVLPARVTDYSPALLDELTVAGEVLWAGHSRLPGSGGGDGLVSLHLADGAPLTLPALEPIEEEGPLDSELHRAVLDLLTGSGGFFLPRVAELTGAEPDAVLEALWDLVWAGQVTNDGLGALRERVSGAGAHRAPRTAPRARPVRRSRFAVSPGRPPSALRASASVPGGGGRWAALPTREADPTVRAHALTQVLLERHGVLTRSGAAAEGVGAGYRDVYRVLSGLEERGAVRRGYFVEHLGGSQFALPGAVDRLRVDAQDRTRIVEAELEVAERTAAMATDTGAGSTSGAVVLAAMDPANPYGAALAWPAGAAPDGASAGRSGGPAAGPSGILPGAATSGGTGVGIGPVDPAQDEAPTSDGNPGNRTVTAHRPGRKAGAVVVLTHGDLALFVERGGRTVLSFTQNPARLAVATAALARTVREGRLGRLVVQRVDGIPALEAARHHPVARALVEAGFAITPRGLRISIR
jgi:ATP-dependent Lhr-like helicase